jgi:N6-L-threonylcarbamoyladenine synthase
MIILGIESSCDETAAAVLKDGHDLLSNVINSQIAVHSPYGGVVPELASRKHIENIAPVVQQALDAADLKLTAVDGIAVTRGPGLIGSLLVGLSFAKALSYVNRIPCVGIDHMAGHLASVMFSRNKPSFPAIALVVSGGHSNLYRLASLSDYQLIGRSRDDAAGEAFDKAAKLLGLGYPGGPVVSRLAASGNPNAIPFPRAWLEPGSYDFSFSGLKTALAHHMQKMTDKPDDAALADICASYQEAIIEVLAVKTIAAAKDHQCRQIIAVGGVASNPRLRLILAQLAQENSVALSIPDREYCTDNAAMIAMAGHSRFAEEGTIDLDMDVYSRTDH